MLDKELCSRNISGAKASARGPAVTHVMYADNIVLFSKTTKNDAEILTKCLDRYRDWSGQSINRSKFGIVFSKHTCSSSRRAIKHQFQMRNLKKEAIYLGAPLFLSRSPSKDFKFLQEKLEVKLSGWRSCCLSWVGRCTLINSVAQALPNYTLSSFNIPKKICDKLDSLTRRFRLKPKEKEGRFLAWKAWDVLCRPKCAGSLNFKKTREMNSALLAKLPWMVCLGERCICMDLLRAKYKVSNDWL